jgi:hypothetical protein
MCRVDVGWRVRRLALACADGSTPSSSLS